MDFGNAGKASKIEGLKPSVFFMPGALMSGIFPWRAIYRYFLGKRFLSV